MFCIKRDENGVAVHWKVHFVAKGYKAVYGVDYQKTTSPTMRLETFRILTHISAALGWTLHQVNVKTAFLRGLLPPGEEVYMEQPLGFAVKGKEDMIWKVKRGLYGLPNGGHVWNKTMNKAMLSFGYKRVPCEHCLYLRVSASGTVVTGCTLMTSWPPSAVTWKPSGSKRTCVPSGRSPTLVLPPSV